MHVHLINIVANLTKLSGNKHVIDRQIMICNTGCSYNYLEIRFRDEMIILHDHNFDVDIGLKKHLQQKVFIEKAKEICRFLLCLIETSSVSSNDSLCSM
uniref:Uncharacterized protein n=1 Tax=Cyprinus carpio TaxID=7962 RepID=A0A8C2HZE9_CYPCA